MKNKIEDLLKIFESQPWVHEFETELKKVRFILSDLEFIDPKVWVKLIDWNNSRLGRESWVSYDVTWGMRITEFELEEKQKFILKFLKTKKWFKKMKKEPWSSVSIKLVDPEDISEELLKTYDSYFDSKHIQFWGYQIRKTQKQLDLIFKEFNKEN